jgi:hypothetical protein
MSDRPTPRGSKEQRLLLPAGARRIARLSLRGCRIKALTLLVFLCKHPAHTFCCIATVILSMTAAMASIGILLDF